MSIQNQNTISLDSRLYDTDFLQSHDLRSQLLRQIQPKTEELISILEPNEYFPNTEDRCNSLLTTWSHHKESTVRAFVQALNHVGLVETAAWLASSAENEVGHEKLKAFPFHSWAKLTVADLKTVPRKLMDNGILQEVTQLLPSKFSEHPVLVLHGVGGAGKTTIARDYYNTQTAYSRRVWLDAKELSEQVKQLMEDWKIVMTNKGNLADNFKAYFQSVTGWLIVFDNAQDSEVLKWCPQGGHVLITSRCANWENSQEKLKLDHLLVGDMTADESCDLLNMWVPHLHPKYKKEVAAKLRYLPLAVATAGAFMSMSHVDNENFKEYLAKLENNMKVVLQDRRYKNSGYPETVFGAFEMSFSRLSGNAKSLLQFAGLVAAQNIPTSLIQRCLGVDSLDLGMLITELRNYHLISQEEQGVSVHDLIHDIMEFKIKENQNQYLVARNTMLLILASELEKYDWNNSDTSGPMIPFVAHAAYFNLCHTEDIYNFDTTLRLVIKLATFYLHHQRKSLDALKLLEGRDFSQLPKQKKAEAWNHIAFAYQQITAAKKKQEDKEGPAQYALTFSMDVITLVAKDDLVYWEEAFAECILALTLFELGKFLEAESHYENAFTIYEKHKRTDTQYLRAMNRYGCIKLEQPTKIREALEVCKTVNESWKILVGNKYDSNEYVARNLNSLAKCYFKVYKQDNNRENLTKARQYWGDSLRIFQNVHGLSVHPGKGEALMGLGACDLAENDQTKAKENFLEAEKHLTGVWLEKCNKKLQKL